MTIASTFTISSTGDIRAGSFTPGTDTRFSTLELHQWLQDLADDASYSGDDMLDILDANPSELAGKRNAVRPMALTLLNGFNIDDSAAQWFKFGSVEQGTANVLYTGLKVLGSLVTNSPIYIDRAGTKLTKYWADSDSSAFQILVKAKAAGSYLGDITVFSRKYGQTFSHFDVDLSPGGEQVAALSTAVDANITLTEGQAETVFGTISIAIGDTTYDIGDGVTRNYKGTITLNGSTTLAQAYQAMQWACSENSTATINSTAGWRYRKLNAAYSENIAAPFGTFAGGKWFVAQGWKLVGVMAADSKNYQLIDHSGNNAIPPTSISIQIGNLVAGDYVLVARDNGSGGILDDEYTVSGSSGAGTVTVTGLKDDTPQSGWIRIAGDKYAYTSWTGTTLTLSGTLSKTYTSAAAFIPMIDTTATGSTLDSDQMTFDANFTARFRVRNGSGSPIVPFESTISVTSTGGSGTVVRTADE